MLSRLASESRQCKPAAQTGSANQQRKPAVQEPHAPRISSQRYARRGHGGRQGDRRNVYKPRETGRKRRR